MLDVPAELRSERVPYPWHLTGPNAEDAYYAWCCKHQPKTRRIYIPIFWWNNSFWQSWNRQQADYVAVPAVQEWIDTHLDPSTKYYTVSNCDDGIYETLPDNVMVFSAGGTGHVPIPLLSDPHPPRDCTKDLLASFIGQLNPDRGGPGTQIRQAMSEVFRARHDCIVEQTWSAKHASLEGFRDLMARSRFALCPRGYGRTSYRFYEAFDFGAVPVYIFDQLWLPYAARIAWGDIAVLCHAKRLDELPARLDAISEDRRQQMVENARAVHENYFTHEGRNRQIARMVA